MEIWPDISIIEAIAIAAVAFFAGVMRGFSGFGAALMTVPVTSAFLGPQMAVPVVTKGISVLIIFFAFLMMRGWRYTGRINGWIMDVVGLFGGFITGAASVGGPPVVTFLMAGPFNAAQNRAAIILYFIFVQSIAMAMYWIGGLLVAQIIGACLLIMPTLMAGMWIDQNLFAKASESGFRRIALSFLMVIGFATLFL